MLQSKSLNALVSSISLKIRQTPKNWADGVFVMTVPHPAYQLAWAQFYCYDASSWWHLRTRITTRDIHKAKRGRPANNIAGQALDLDGCLA